MQMVIFTKSTLSFSDPFFLIFRRRTNTFQISNYLELKFERIQEFAILNNETQTSGDRSVFTIQFPQMDLLIVDKQKTEMNQP